MSDEPRLLGLLTDFGLEDGYVGVMKAVALTIAPLARLIDITHAIRPQDVEGGAWTLGATWRSFPIGSVFLCVVDPGVGSARRAVALQAHGRYFVGPDNGLFTYPLHTEGGHGDVVRCVNLDNARYYLPSVSATFHGRDIFAPCAAHLLNGVALAELGSPIDPEMLIRLPIELAPSWRGDALVARVAHIDHYGNLITNVGPTLAQQALSQPRAHVEVRGQRIRQRATHFEAAAVGAPFFLQDSSGVLAIAMRDASAASALGVQRGDIVTVHGMSASGEAGSEQHGR